ncbi:hypothetical protein [Alteriqipengyuania sp. 357]
MRVDPIDAPAARPARRGFTGRLEAALIALAHGEGDVIDHRERNWASVTFAGTRHSVRIAFEGTAAIDGGEALIAALPDHEFTFPRRLVADATVSAVDHALAPAPRMVVTCELLVLEDG